MRAAQVGHDVCHLRTDTTDSIQDQDGARGQYQDNSIFGTRKKKISGGIKMGSTGIDEHMQFVWCDITGTVRVL